MSRSKLSRSITRCYASHAFLTDVLTNVLTNLPVAHAQRAEGGGAHLCDKSRQLEGHIISRI